MAADNPLRAFQPKDSMLERIDHQRAIEDARLTARHTLNEHNVPFEAIPYPLLNTLVKRIVDSYQDSRVKAAARSSGSP